MNLKEYNDNRFVKEQDEVEKYLLRIIERYFDMENINTQASIENMKVEALTRIKQWLVDKNHFLFSFNEKTGDIILTIKDLGGEYKFDKLTAFNKKFGNISDTICEGNDLRLSDNRNPLEHIHTISQIKQLKELLDSLEYSSGNHSHFNKRVLDIIQYTGERIEIDLIILEQLQKSIQEYIKELQYRQKETNAIKTPVLEKLSNYIDELQNNIDNMKSIIDASIDWLGSAYEYTSSSVNEYRTNAILGLSKDLLSKSLRDKLIGYLKKNRIIIDTGEFELSDGTLTCNPVEVESIIEASSEEGDSLYKIYTEGLCLGRNDLSTSYHWSWNNSLNSFVYEGNEDTSYPRFISLSSFDKYVHRVTLKSSNGDDDALSVVLAYNTETGDDLSLICSPGGISSINDSLVPHASIALNAWNLSKSYAVNNYTAEKVIDKITIGEYRNWSQLSNGITVLVHKDGNIFKIWINYNTPNIWRNTMDEPSTPPSMVLDISLYPELSVFMDKPVNYGYGTFSQPYSFYEDVYFAGSGEISEEKTGYTEVIENGTTMKDISPNVMSKMVNGKVKLYIKFEEDGFTNQYPLPYIFKDSNERTIVVTGSYDSNGKIEIHTNMISNIPLYFDNSCFYNPTTLYIPTGIYKSVYQHQYFADDNNLTFALVDNVSKNNFIKDLLKEGKLYLIQGHIYYSETYKDDNNNSLSYFNWDTEEPVECPEYETLNICMNSNGKWKNISKTMDTAGCVMEYHIQKLSNYLTNPRIYYEVYSTKEGS